MAFKLHSRVRETTTSLGTGDLVLAGALPGFNAFGDYYANGDTMLVVVAMGTQWETFLGTYNSGAGSISRTTMFESTNADAAVDWGAGMKDIAVTNVALSDLDASTLAAYRGLFGLLASEIAFTPAGDIAATDVQAAIAELDTEKVAKVATTVDNTMPRFNGTLGEMQGGGPVVDDDGGMLPAHIASVKFTVADDAAASFTVADYGLSGVIHMAAIITATGDVAGFFYFRVTNTPLAAVSAGAGFTANVVFTTGVLTGTTGADGKLTIATHTDGKLYIENRLGNSKFIALTFFGST